MEIPYRFKHDVSYSLLTVETRPVTITAFRAKLFERLRRHSNVLFDVIIRSEATNRRYVGDSDAEVLKNEHLELIRVPLATNPKPNRKHDFRSVTAREPVNQSAYAWLQRAKVSSTKPMSVSEEEDRIRAAIDESSKAYEDAYSFKAPVVALGPYQWVNRQPSRKYTCYNCGVPGHWLKDCKFDANATKDMPRKRTGMPKSFFGPNGMLEIAAARPIKLEQTDVKPLKREREPEVYTLSDDDDDNIITSKRTKLF